MNGLELVQNLIESAEIEGFEFSFYKNGEKVCVEVEHGRASIRYGAKEKSFRLRSNCRGDILDFLSNPPGETCTFTDLDDHTRCIGVGEAHRIIFGAGTISEKINRLWKKSVPTEESMDDADFVLDDTGDWEDFLTNWTDSFGDGPEPRPFPI